MVIIMIKISPSHHHDYHQCPHHHHHHHNDHDHHHHDNHQNHQVLSNMNVAELVDFVKVTHTNEELAYGHHFDDDNDNAEDNVEDDNDAQMVVHGQSDRCK